MKPSLLVFDFDQTIANTFIKGPNGMGVKEAYLQSAIDIFGQEVTKIFRFDNNSPSQIVHNILLADQNGEMLDRANHFLETNKERLERQIGSHKGIALDTVDNNIEKVIIELLVQQKLTYLLDQVGATFPDGTTWPSPCDGFLDFWKNIQDANKEDLSSINTAIVSSGHEVFIRKVFDLWNINYPDIIISEDDVRGRKYPTEIERRAKPGSLQFALAHHEWLKILNGPYNFDLEDAKETRSRIMYFGDDLIKDGLLAQSADVHFVWFNPEGKLPNVTIKNSSIIRNYSEIRRDFYTNLGLSRK